MNKEIEIPEGYEAKIVGNKVVLEPKESEDERIRKRLIDCLKFSLKGAEEQDAAGCSRKKDIEAYKWGLAYLEKQKEQKPVMIQWTGDNLRDVVEFTGKSPKFGEWFKSWDEFESYVHSHGDIFKLFYEDGSHYEVPVGAWIVKTPDGYNVPSVARFVSSSTERQRRNANGCLSWKDFKDDDSGIPALLVSGALIRRDGKYSTGFNIISGDEYILIRDIEDAIVQKPAEWSEEDEAIACKLEYILRVNVVSPYIINWALEHLRPQPHWKPSEKQLSALERCVDYLDESDNEDAWAIGSLCHDLKNL